jgi:predicted transcriptional regulator
MLTPERKLQLDKRLEEIGVDRMLADESTTYTTFFGGGIEDRLYAGQWVKKTLEARTNTSRMLQEGKPAIRRAIMEVISEADGGAMWERDIADQLSLELPVVQNALDYLEREGLLEQKAIGSPYNITHLGEKEMEEAQQHPERSTLHFPATQVNNYYGNAIVSTGDNNHITQINYGALPTELKELAEGLRIADGGTISPESEVLVKALEQGESQLKIASAAEDVASKGKVFHDIITKFKDELIKKGAEKGLEGAIKGSEWLYKHAPVAVTAIQLWMQHRHG